MNKNPSTFTPFIITLEIVTDWRRQFYNWIHSVTVKMPIQLNGIFPLAATSVCLWDHSTSADTFCPLLYLWRGTKANRISSLNEFIQCTLKHVKWHRHNTTTQIKGWKSRGTLKKWLAKQKSLLPFMICKTNSASHKRNSSKTFWLQRSGRKEKTRRWYSRGFVEDTLSSHIVLTTSHFYLS